MDVELGKEKLELEPMSFKTQKAVFKLVVRGLALQAQAKSEAQRAAVALLAGTGQGLSVTTLVEVLEEIPDLLTKALALGTGFTEDQIDSCVKRQFWALIQAFVELNELVEAMEDAKKALAPFRPAKAEPQKAPGEGKLGS